MDMVMRLGLLLCAHILHCQGKSRTVAELLVGDETQLFLDDSDIERMAGIKFKLHRPREMGKVVISDQPWENMRIWAYNSMIDNGTHVLLYYHVSSLVSNSSTSTANNPTANNSVRAHTCLAVSSDGGRTFQKPSLGVISFNGSTDNNIVWPPYGAYEPGSVFIDTRPGVPQAEKYKMIANWNDGPSGDGQYVMSSPDGIHFRTMSDRPAFTGSDTQQVFFWDGRLGKYVAYRRAHSEGVKSTPVRSCQWCLASTQGSHCGAGAPTKRGVARCLSDRPEVFNGCGGDGPWNASVTLALWPDEYDSPCVDFYTNAVIQYGKYYLMFPTAYLHYPEPPAWPLHNDGVWDTRFMYSHDGSHFSYVDKDRGAWLERGLGQLPKPTPKNVQELPGGSWDSGMVAAVRGYTVQGDSIFMYKWGDVVRHGNGHVVSPQTGISRLQLRLDGWASASSTLATNSEWPRGDSQNSTLHNAELTTVPLSFGIATNAGGQYQLLLNLDVQLEGLLLVEMLDAASGQPLAGYTAEECVPLIGNYIGVPVQWCPKGLSRTECRSDVSSLSKRSVKLRFLMKGSVDIFSYRFSHLPEPSLIV